MTGGARYTADISVPRTAHAAIVHSSECGPSLHRSGTPTRRSRTPRSGSNKPTRCRTAITNYAPVNARQAGPCHEICAVSLIAEENDLPRKAADGRLCVTGKPVPRCSPSAWHWRVRAPRPSEGQSAQGSGTQGRHAHPQSCDLAKWSRRRPKPASVRVKIRALSKLKAAARRSPTTAPTSLSPQTLNLPHRARFANPELAMRSGTNTSTFDKAATCPDWRSSFPSRRRSSPHPLTA